MKELLKNFICSWICCWLIFYPTLSYADDKVVVDDPIPINKGQVAPFSGVLFPTLKAAQLTAQLESFEASCALKTKKEVDLAVSVVQLKLDNCSSSRAVLEDMYKTQIQSQREYINFLEKKATSPKISREVVFIIGIVAGVGITIGAGYAMRQAAQ
jgi:hypothetical protein